MSERFFWSLEEDHSPDTPVDGGSIDFHGIYATAELAIHIIECAWIARGPVRILEKTAERWRVRDSGDTVEGEHEWLITRLRMNDGVSSCLKEDGTCRHPDWEADPDDD